jgi:hypothetical protein
MTTAIDDLVALLVPTFNGECILRFQEGDKPSYVRAFEFKDALDATYAIKPPEIRETIMLSPSLPDDAPDPEYLEPSLKVGNWTYTVQNGRARLSDGSWIGG